MGYAYNARQLAAIQRMLRGEHNIITPWITGERADYKNFNYKYDEIQGCLSYIKENSGTALAIVVRHLRDIGDVVAPNPNADDFLVFDGEYWVPRAIEIPKPEDLKTNISQLEDVVLEELTDKNILIYDEENAVWKNSVIDLEPPSIQELQDVRITNLEPNHILEFDGVNWVNVDTPVVIKRISLMQDVGVFSPTQDQILKYDARDERWVNYTLTLDSISGMDLANPTNGQVIEYDSLTQSWKNKTPNNFLSGLIGDVSIVDPPQDGDALFFINGSWKNKAIPSTIKILSGLEDVSIGTPLDGQVLKFDSLNEKWINAIHAERLDELKDISIQNPQQNDVVRFNFNTKSWESKPISFSSLSDVGFSNVAVSDVPIYGNGVWSNISFRLSNLIDTNIINLDEYNTLVYRNGAWSNVGFSIFNLTDVYQSQLQGGQALIYDLSVGKFTNTTLAANSLSDFNIVSPQDGDNITFDFSSGRWVSKAPPKVINFLSGLNDVGVGDIQQGQLLTYNAENELWENKTLNIENINDTLITNKALKNILSYNGQKWINTFIDSSYLSDFSFLNLLDKQVPYYNGATNKWENKYNKLFDLYDVSINTPGLNQVLLYDSSADRWINELLRFDTHFGDININSPQNGQAIVFNGFKWTNSSLNSLLSGLEDISLDQELNNNQSLIFNSELNKWTNSTLVYRISELTDTNLDSASDGEVLTYDAASLKWVGAKQLISNLFDVELNNLLDGQFLTYDAAENKWINITQQAIISNLSGLDDVEISTNPEQGEFLYFGSENKWTNTVLKTEKIKDLNINNPLNGQALVYNEDDNLWENSAPHLRIEDIKDVELSNPTPNQSLIYNGVKWVNGGLTSQPTTQTTYQMDLDYTVTRVDDPSNIADRIYAVQNIGEFEVYIGFDSSVSKDTGYILYPGDNFRVTLYSSGTLYAFSGFGTGRIAIMRGR